MYSLRLNITAKNGQQKKDQEKSKKVKKGQQQVSTFVYDEINKLNRTLRKHCIKLYAN